MARVLLKRRIIVTRPRLQAAGLVRALTDGGAEVLALPLIRIDPPKNPRPLAAVVRGLARGTAKPDILLFTSANAASVFLGRLGPPAAVRRLLRGVRVYAVGAKTAAVVRAHGLRATTPDDANRAEGLLHMLQGVRGKSVLFPRTERARELLPKELRRRGAKVRIVKTYRTVVEPSQARRLKTALLGSRAVDAVTFTSPSTVESLAALLTPRRFREVFEDVAAVSIGPVTSAALRRRGLRRIIEARTPSEAGLARALRSFFAKRFQ